MNDVSMDDGARALGEMLAASTNAIAFTGAGISTESGIPDFRGPQGLWTKMDPSEFTIQNYLHSSEHRRKVWRMRTERAQVNYEPNAGHRALAELERAHILTAVVTQNVDGLHQQAGSRTVLELHGSPRIVRCMSCARTQPHEDVLARVRAGEEDPPCTDCGGILKSGTISFGESMPGDVVDDAFSRARSCDFCLVVGSSLVVYPAAGIPLEALHHGARLAIVNEEPTPLDDFATLTLGGKAGEILTEASREALGSRS
jgi:NAD-dependent deacetylase